MNHRLYAGLATICLTLLSGFQTQAESAIEPMILKVFEKNISLPSVYSTALFAERDGIRPMFFEGASYQGKPTRVFAWLGLPPGDGKVPAVVLVHGGGGTAMRDWVKLWVDRGYAAIAPDMSGRVPESDSTFRVKGRRHEWAGPNEKGNGFRESAAPLTDQWMFHAIFTLFGAERLLANESRVDAQRIGITGISWGGVMTEIAASLNPNFKCAVPIYGCGFLGKDSYWKEKHFPEMDPALVTRWLQLWDPSVYLPRMKRPILFVNGTSDKYFRTDVWSQTTRLPDGPVSRSLRVGLPHGNPPHGDPPEVKLFMDSNLKEGTPLPRVTDAGTSSSEICLTFQSEVELASANLFYTLDDGAWNLRKWTHGPAIISKDRITAKIPEKATAYFLGIETANQARVSGPLSVRVGAN